MNFRSLIVKEKKEEVFKKEEDFLDFFDDEDVVLEKKLPSIEELRNVFGAWCLEIRAKVPNASPDDLRNGVFQVYWSEQYDKPTEIAEADLNSAFILIPEGKMPLTEFKRRFIEVIMCRTSFWKNGVPQRGYEGKYQAFRQRLSEFVKMPEGWV